LCDISKRLSDDKWRCFVIVCDRELDVFELPMLVVAALVGPATQLGAVVLARTLYVQHLIQVIEVHDLVAVYAPELLAIAYLELVRVQTVTCSKNEVYITTK